MHSFFKRVPLIIPVHEFGTQLLKSCPEMGSRCQCSMADDRGRVGGVRQCSTADDGGRVGLTKKRSKSRHLSVLTISVNH